MRLFVQTLIMNPEFLCLFERAELIFFFALTEIFNTALEHSTVPLLRRLSNQSRGCWSACAARAWVSKRRRVSDATSLDPLS